MPPVDGRLEPLLFAIVTVAVPAAALPVPATPFAVTSMLTNSETAPLPLSPFDVSAVIIILHQQCYCNQQVA